MDDGADLQSTVTLRLWAASKGDILVQAGWCLHLLRGIVTGDVTVEAGAPATLDGLIFGTVFNHGGQVKLHGKQRALDDAAKDL